MRARAWLLTIGACSFAGLHLAWGGEINRAFMPRDDGFLLGGAFGTATIRGGEFGNAWYPGVAAMVHGGYQFQNGLRPEVVLSYADFSGSAYSNALNLFASPGLRWRLSESHVRPWLGAHFDLGTFAASCSSDDPRNRRCVPGGLYLGYDVGVGVDWMITHAISIGSQMAWTHASPVSPPLSEPAPAGYPAAPERSYVMSWLTLAAGATIYL